MYRTCTCNDLNENMCVEETLCNANYIEKSGWKGVTREFSSCEEKVMPDTNGGIIEIDTILDLGCKANFGNDFWYADNQNEFVSKCDMEYETFPLSNQGFCGTCK